mmetsp:Transcript_43506/g.141114  ORF Transcript_43506/g.141114 Transcript_43506/m.141114 type:complete len:352 (-) Transcript_43506:170-1225(-)
MVLSTAELAALEPQVREAMPLTYNPAPAGLPQVACGFDCSARGRVCAPCAQSFFSCIAGFCGGMDVRSGSETQPIPMFTGMLGVDAAPACPDDLKGVFWQRDSSTVETMLTFSDATWVGPAENDGSWIATKRNVLAWTSVPSCFGQLFWSTRALVKDQIPCGALCCCCAGGVVPIQVSPSGELVLFNGHQWMIKVKEGDAIVQVSEDGSPSPVRVGDWLRVDFQDTFKPSRETIVYMYVVQRVARLDGSTVVLDTSGAYAELKRRAEMESIDQCGHRFACCVSAEQLEAMLIAQSDMQIYCVPKGAPAPLAPRAMARYEEGPSDPPKKPVVACPTPTYIAEKRKQKLASLV